MKCQICANTKAYEVIGDIAFCPDCFETFVIEPAPKYDGLVPQAEYRHNGIPVLFVGYVGFNREMARIIYVSNNEAIVPSGEIEV